MTIGIPLAILKTPEGKHEIVLHFSGVGWTMYVDGQLLDNDFPFGYPQWAGQSTWKMDPEYVVQAAIYLPAIKPEKRSAPWFDLRLHPILDSAWTQLLGRRCRYALPQGTLSRLLPL